ncbi:MAG: hypothetical protein C6H99_01670 [Epsilonproteobacteria bacterium]|nr:hypothetical protein [Campylobacterota bacterium]NPA63943.1 hypothetical protein [Campylobacterota bacterium]
MSTKENLEYIKQELSNDEKLLESVIKAEKFYKKYHKHFKIALIALIVGTLGYLGYEWKKEADLRASNEAYMKLMSDPKNKEALKILESKNEKLYMLYLYRQAFQEQDQKTLEKIAQKQMPVLSDLASYHLAALKKDEAKLYGYGSRPEAILKEMALLDDGYLNMKSGKVDIAHQRLGQIGQDSLAYPFARLLAHYGVKAK